MLNKRLIQVLLISAALVLVIISLIYVKNTRENLSSNDNVKINTLKNDSNNNIIENISYISEDTDGNRFEIRARVGELDNDKPEIIEMKDVTGIIYLSKNKKVLISSKLATYNKTNFYTLFRKDVELLYDNNIVTSQKLELVFEKNIINISENIIYKGVNSNLNADYIEIDLIKKTSKIFMDKIGKKVTAKYWD